VPHIGITEEEAFIALQTGDERGLDYYFNSYNTPLVYFALRLTGNEGTAEDIAAESFVKLWQHRADLTHAGSVKSYLYKTVRHAAIDFLRHQRRKRAHQQEVVYLNMYRRNPSWLAALKRKCTTSFIRPYWPCRPNAARFSPCFTSRAKATSR